MQSQKMRNVLFPFRDGLLEDKASKNKMIHSMLKETKALSNSLKKQQRQNAKLVEKFNEAKAEIVTLQSNLSVSSGSQYSRGRQTNDSEMEIMRVGKNNGIQASLAFRNWWRQRFHWRKWMKSLSN